MTMLRSGVLGVLAGTATFVALQHADRLRESLATDEVVGRLAESLRPHLPAAAEPPAAAPAPAEPAATPPPDGSAPAAAANPASAPPQLQAAMPPDRPAAPAAAAAREPAPAEPSLQEAGRRAADLAEAMDRLSKRLGRSTPGGAR